MDIYRAYLSLCQESAGQDAIYIGASTTTDQWTTALVSHRHNNVLHIRFAWHTSHLAILCADLSLRCGHSSGDTAGNRKDRDHPAVAGDRAPSNSPESDQTCARPALGVPLLANCSTPKPGGPATGTAVARHDARPQKRDEHRVYVPWFLLAPRTGKMQIDIGGHFLWIHIATVSCYEPSNSLVCRPVASLRPLVRRHRRQSKGSRSPCRGWGSRSIELTGERPDLRPTRAWSPATRQLLNAKAGRPRHRHITGAHSSRRAPAADGHGAGDAVESATKVAQRDGVLGTSGGMIAAARTPSPSASESSPS
jgi:hypothetical protein